MAFNDFSTQFTDVLKSTFFSAKIGPTKLTDLGYLFDDKGKIIGRVDPSTGETREVTPNELEFAKSAGYVYEDSKPAKPALKRPLKQTRGPKPDPVKSVTIDEKPEPVERVAVEPSPTITIATDGPVVNVNADNIDNDGTELIVSDPTSGVKGYLDRMTNTVDITVEQYQKYLVTQMSLGNRVVTGEIAGKSGLPQQVVDQITLRAAFYRDRYRDTYVMITTSSGPKNFGKPLTAPIATRRPIVLTPSTVG